MLEQGAPGQLLAGEGLLDSFALAALAPNAAGSSQEEIVPGARFRSQVRAPSLSAMGNQFAMTFSSPLAASMPSS